MENNQHLLHFNKINNLNLQSNAGLVDRLQARAPQSTWGQSGDAIRPIVSAALEQSLTLAASRFRRDSMLPRLIPVGPADLADTSPGGRWRILLLLAKALRGERARGRAGHWTYSLNRHIGLLQAFRAERRAFRARFPNCLRILGARQLRTTLGVRNQQTGEGSD